MKKIFFSLLLLSVFSSFAMQQVMLKLKQNAELNRKLLYAVVNSSEADVKTLLQAGADPNTLQQFIFSEKLSALHVAAVKNNTIIVQELLKHGANPSLKDTEGNTPLHKAAGRGNSQTLELLLKTDSSTVNEQNKSGICESGYDFSTPLHLAINAADLASVKLLIEHGAMLDKHRNRYGKTPRENLYFGLQLLCSHRYEPILNYLKENNF